MEKWMGLRPRARASRAGSEIVAEVLADVRRFTGLRTGHLAGPLIRTITRRDILNAVYTCFYYFWYLKKKCGGATRSQVGAAAAAVLLWLAAAADSEVGGREHSTLH